MTSSGVETFRPSPFGNYLLVERIGAGGMAEIFRAKTFGAAGFEKEYAIKRILPNLGLDHEFVSMFVNEAKLVVDLYHPNIVQVFDLGQIDGAFFIAMEFVQGKDLLDLLARCAENDLKIPLKLTMFIMMEMLKGLDFAHNATDRSGEELNIIHRDVSPSNIMLSYTGHVKIGDFGVAKARTQRRLTEVGTLKGKVGYMSPEQVRGEEIDRRSDIFAAGIILYESLTMTRLYMGGNDLDVMLKIRDSDVGQDLARCRKVPPSLLAILYRALAKNPQDRYQSCEEFHADIQNFAYRHDIKTGNTDLSAFLHRVFAEEIQAEKAQRLEDPGYSMAQLIQHAPAGTLDPEQDAGTSHAASGPHPSPLSPEAVSARLGEIFYRYRDPFGREYGPMTLAEMRDFLSQRIENKREKVRLGNGPWRPLPDFPDLQQTTRPPAEPFSQIPTLTGADAQPLKDEATGKVSQPSPTPSTPESEGIAPTHQGQLGRITLTRLLFRLARKRSTGKLQVESGEHHKEIYLRKGEPVVVTSSMPEELLGNYLLRKKIITKDQLKAALDRISEYGGRLGDAIVGAKVLTTHELFRYLSEQLEDRILNLFTWPAGAWSWFANCSAPYQSVPMGVDPLDILVVGIRSHLPISMVTSHFAERKEIPLEICPQGVNLEEIPLLAHELEMAAEVTTGHTPLEVIHTLTGHPGRKEEDAWRLLYLLTELEIFHLPDGLEEGRLLG
ncbi:MAG: protein kinase [Bradymonadales bacterium]|nr:protein kinase [Bradymonadales bacterium]